MFRIASIAICLNLLLVINIQAQVILFESIENEQHGVLSKNPEGITVRGNDAIIDQGNEDSEESQDEEEEDYSRVHKVFVPSPEQGFVDSVHGEANLELIEKGLTGQVALFHMALTQTEPALAAGFTSASQFSDQMNARAHRDYQLIKDRSLHANDQGSRDILAGIYNCLGEQTEDKNIDSTENVLEACLGTETAEIRNSENLNEAEDRGIRIENHPLYLVVYEENSNFDLDSTEGESVSVKDAMFSLLDTKKVASERELNGLYEDFRTFFHDLELSVETDESGNLELRDDIRARTTSNSHPANNINRLANLVSIPRWMDLMEVFNLVCDSGQDSNGNPANLYEAERNYFQSLEQRAELFKNLSTSEVPFNEFTARLLVDVYLTHRKGRRQELCEEFTRYRDAVQSLSLIHI